jgi:hypothetical protein
MIIGSKDRPQTSNRKHVKTMVWSFYISNLKWQKRPFSKFKWLKLQNNFLKNRNLGERKCGVSPSGSKKGILPEN